MTYSTTYDEKATGFYSSNASAYSDAPYSTSTVYTLAQGTSWAAYGLLALNGGNGDADTYSMGILQAGTYTVTGTSAFWFFGTGYASYITPTVYIYDSQGNNIYASGTSSSKSFTVTTPSPYYATVFGVTYSASQYELYYTYSAPVNYYVVSNAYLVGSPVVGNTLSVGGTFSDQNGTTTSIVTYHWYIGSAELSTATSYTIQSGDVGKNVDCILQYRDDAGYLETFSTNVVTVVGLDTIRPTITITSNDTSLKAGGQARITFRLSESSTNFSASDVTVAGGVLSGFGGSNALYDALFTPTASGAAIATISVGSGTFSDATGNFNLDGADANNTVSISVDTVSPTIVGYSPVNQATGVGVNTSIVATLSEGIYRGQGNVILETIDGGVIETFDVNTSPNFTIFNGNSGTTLTVTPSKSLSYGTSYKLVFTSGCITDFAGNTYAGSSNYNFTTNGIPVATSATVNAVEDTAKTGTLAGTDPEGSTLTFAKVASPSHGTVTINASTGAYVYTPASNYNGADSFTFKINDGTADSAASTVSITVSAVNDAPVAINTNVSTAEDIALTSTLPAATDADGDTITYSKVSEPAHGTVSVSTGGGFTYTPNANYNGVDSFSYSVSDGQSGLNTYTANVTISAVNDAPTGVVTITGTATQGQSLTATNTLADADGLGTISYQWRAAGVNISGATSSTLILAEAQVGKAISVTASYTDGQGTLESSTSTATGVVANVNDAPTGSVTITGTATQGQTLTASNNLADADGLGTISYQWKAEGANIANATSATVVLAEAQVGKPITVVASYTDSHGTVESVSSSASASVANVNDLPTGSVTISGTATQGQTLTTANTLADLDGLGTISYQWKAGGSAIAGATASTLALTQAQVGKTVTVTASYTDGHGTAESATSTASATVANINDAPTGVVTIAGTASRDQTLTAANTLADPDGLGTISYQWKAGGVNISGATASSYKLTQSEVGKTVTVTAGYTDLMGTAESVSSLSTSTVTGINTTPTGTVTISGTATQGRTLAAANSLADADGLGSIGYQWLVNGTAVSGATGSTFVLTEAQVGKTITVTASYIDGYGTAESKTSAATGVVANINDSPTGNITITGTPTQGQVLTATSTLADLDGLGTISYQWKANGTAISGATTSTLALIDAQVGKVITVVASYIDGHGTAETVTSNASTSVANLNDPPTGSVSIVGTVAQGETLTLTNTLADPDGLGTFSYLWKADAVAIPGATLSSFTLSQAQVGKTIAVSVSYTDGHGTAEGVTSAATRAVTNVNDSPTGTVTISGTATQGQTLTASNNLADADGMGTVSYQWKASGLNISGATAASYALTAGEVGKTITVTASYTDGLGTAESKTSIASAAVSQTVNAKVHDGYVSGAAIYIDTNGNGIADPTENTGVLTDAQGNFSLSTTLSGSIIAKGGTNTDTGLANTLSLTAPQGSGVINPITTLIQSYAKTAGVSASVAETAVQTALGISANVDLTQYDPLSHGSTDATGLSVQHAVAQIAQVGLQSQAEGVGFSTVAQALATGIQSGKSIDLTSSTQLQSVLGSVVSSQALSTSASNNTTIASASTLQAIASVQTTVTPVAVATFSPADETQGVGVADNIVLSFNKPIQLASGSILLKTAAGTTVASYDAASSANLSVSGSTLTINPTKDLGIFTGYKVEIAAGAVKDLAGNSFAGVSDYNFSTQTLDSLYHFCVVAFSAAPGTAFMGQMADAYNAGLSVKEIVNIFTTKSQFTSTYAQSLSDTELATLLVANVVKDSATAATKSQAISDIVGALTVWTRGDMIYQVFGNLATKPLNDPDWGNTALQFNNQTEVARHFTEVMHNSTTDMSTLKAVIGSVMPSSDVSTPAVIATLIGVELSHVV